MQLPISSHISISRERRTISVPAPDEIALRRPTLDDAFLALTGQPPAASTPADDPLAQAAS